MREKLLSLLIIFPSLLLAQRGEVRLPLQGNPAIKQYLQQHPLPEEKAVKKGSFFKNAGRFPLIDRFQYAGDSLKVTNWVPGGATKNGRRVVLNALNAAGTAYAGGAGSFGLADTLKSVPVNLTTSSGNLYIKFGLSTGTTWQNGDSLTLECLTPSGSYQTVWTSPNVSLAQTDIIVPLNYSLYYSPNFDFKFTVYTQRLLSNTETFVLYDVAVTDKWSLPAYENFLTAVDSVAAPLYWFQSAVTVLPGSVKGLSFGQIAVFNAFDENKQLYAGASGASDTLYSNLIDVEQFKTTDSVYLRFYYQPFPSATNADTLHLELKNNLGVWQRVWFATGAQISDIDTAIRQINIGRFRHPNLQFRLINSGTHSANDTAQFLVTGVNIGKKLLLPFLDDFSATEVYPDLSRFTSRHVYVNNHFPKKAPSRNVATFDGLDFRGNPYGSIRGYCDTLTSQPINLHGYAAKDSIYLTFWIEPQGFGEAPNAADSLVLDFRTNAVNGYEFKTVRNISPAFLAKDSFVEIRVPVTDSIYLHDDFQFRIKNIGSKSGNLNHWHVDYIRMDKGRGLIDFYQDVAITSVPSSMLNKYQSIPAKHYLVNPSLYLDDVQKLGMKNNNGVSYSVNFSREVFDPNYTRIDTFGNVNPNLVALTNSVVNINKLTPLPVQNFNQDSIVFTSRYTLSGSGGDNIYSNDTATSKTIFSNYFAYDDGSAEAGYAIKNAPGAVALGFDLAVQDTLYGVSMFFNRSTADVSGKAFYLMVWQAVNTNGNATGEIELKRVLFGGPSYTGKLNGFYYYKFDAHLTLPPGKFYIGWEQPQIFELNIGLDENYAVNDTPAVNPDMWYKIDGLWDRTILTGALMMRPIFGKWLDPPVGIVEPLRDRQLMEASVFPNPATDLLYIKIRNQTLAKTELFDISGKLVQTLHIHEEGEMELNNLESGLYFLKITSEQNSVTKKIIINR